MLTSNISNFEPLVGRYFTSQLIFQDRASGFRYLANAKSGSSAVKRFLIESFLDADSRSENSSPHSAGWTSNVLGEDDSARPFTFSIVRNPYTRILSAYLDKIRRPGILHEQFRLQHGIAPNQEISFHRFLECLTSSDTILDQHYRPQVQNLYVGYMHIDTIWPLEALDDALFELGEQFSVKATTPARGKHVTDASAKLAEFFNDDCLALARNLYREDFCTFGYSQDLNLAGAVIPTLRDIPPFEDGWQNLLSADSAEGPPPPAPEGASERLCFYTKVAQSAWEGDATSLLTMLQSVGNVEKEHYIITRAVDILKTTTYLTKVEDMIDRLIKIAPFIVKYRFQKIKMAITKGKARTSDDVTALVLEAKKTTWQHANIDALLTRAEGEKIIKLEHDMTLPKITDSLVRFVAIRLAGVTFKEWQEIDGAERKRILEQTRGVLKAERRFFERNAEKITTDVKV